LAIVVSPIGASFHFVDLPPLLWLLITVLVAAYLAAAEAIKRFAISARPARSAGGP
jgi:hypothetical protein